MIYLARLIETCLKEHIPFSLCEIKVEHKSENNPLRLVIAGLRMDEAGNIVLIVKEAR